MPCERPPRRSKRVVEETAFTRLQRWLLPLVLVLASLAAFGCARGGSQDGVRVGIIGNIDSLSPIYDRAPDARVVQSTYLRGFVQWTASGELRPEWASDVPSTQAGTFRGNADMASFSFRLKPQAAWSDGKPLTFDDFMFAYRVLLHPFFRKGHAWWTAPIRGFTQTGDRLTFTVSRANDHDGLDIFPLPRHVLEGALNGDPDHFSGLAFHQTPLSSGPFVVTGRTYNSVELARNPAYTPRPAGFERLVFQLYPTAEEALIALKKGAVDAVDRIPLDEAYTLTESDAVNLTLVPGPRLVMLVFNTRTAPFNDMRVRLALAHATDRPLVMKTLGGLKAIATDSWTQPTRSGYTPSFASYRGDVTKARAALEASGWRVLDGHLVRRTPAARRTAPARAPGKGAAASPPVSLRLLFDSEAPDQAATASILQKSWQRLGLTVTLDGRQRASHITDLRQGAFTVALQAVEVYPWTQPSSCFAEDSIPTERNNFHGDNVARWTSTKSAPLLKQIAQASCPAAVAPLVSAHERLLAIDVPVLPLYFTPLAAAYRDGLAGLAPRAFGGITWNIEEWSRK